MVDGSRWARGGAIMVAAIMVAACSDDESPRAQEVDYGFVGLGVARSYGGSLPALDYSYAYAGFYSTNNDRRCSEERVSGCTVFTCAYPPEEDADPSVDVGPIRVRGGTREFRLEYSETQYTVASSTTGRVFEGG